MTTTAGYMARALARGESLPEPVALRPEDIREWRIAESLTQVQAAKIAGVGARAWQRWEGGERPIPESLRDVLAHRWGSAP
jgi:DNA-binding transcriptional regulator YiaG